MKLVKLNTLNEELLKEAEDIELDTSKEEIADEVKDTADEIGKPVSDEEAKEIAELSKEAGDKIGAEQVVIVDDDAPLDLKNALTDALNDALADNIGFREDGINEVANVLVSGLPGSSKTATIYNWAKGKTISGTKLTKDTPEADKVHITYLNAKNNDIEAFINGYTVQDPEDKLSVRQAVSHNLDGLDRPNSILFLDEYNRQTKDQIRASLLTLINEHYVTGKEEGGKHYFPNFLFTIAAINPAGTAEDEGAAMMNDAERSRFLYTVKDFDSSPSVTIDYLNEFYLKKAKKEANSPEPNWPKIERFLRIWHLGTYICKHEDFQYDDKSKLNKLFVSQSKMLNQRLLTAALAASRGSVEKFKRYIDNSSGFLPEDIEMLDEILEDYMYVLPTFDDLLKIAEINRNKPEENNSEDNKSEETKPEDGASADVRKEEEEDDDDLFVGQNNSAASSTISPNEATKRIQDAISGWGI